MPQKKVRKKGRKGLPKRTGKDSMKAKVARYFARRPEKKLRRILADHGPLAAEAWATAHNGLLMLARIQRRG